MNPFESTIPPRYSDALLGYKVEGKYFGGMRQGKFLGVSS